MTYSVNANAAQDDAAINTAAELAHAGTFWASGHVLREGRRHLAALDGGAVGGADTEKADILALVAHEFRGPLSAIRAALVLIDRRIGTECARERAIIGRQLGTLVRLVEDLLDASRMARDGMALHCEHVSLREVVTHALETTAPLRHAMRHRLRARLPDAKLLVYADSMRLAQVFGNLLSNAARYTPQGGRIEIDVQVTVGSCCVRVKDNGRGIEPDALRHLFEPYFQGPGSEQAMPRGLGLGLALVKAITERHGGTVTVRSDGRGLGSEFSVRLPLSAHVTVATPAVDRNPRRSI